MVISEGGLYNSRLMYKGPMPQGDETRPCAGEQSVALTRDFRLIQKLRGHRYSVDDMLVAHLACSTGEAPQRVLDLGCGLGSVLLITAWAFPEAELVGLEVLDEHLDFARRNILLNGCEERARVMAGDLRNLSLVASLGSFDLVTGSPPYFPQGSGTLCADPARAAAHFELRGGIEAYAAAASQALAPGGRFVCCAAAAPLHRTLEALDRAGLSPRYLQPVIPVAAKEPFLLLMVATKESAAPFTEEAPPLVLRDEQGRRTRAHRAIRAWTGV